ncbi:carboxypeptidase-like regulatory domain-containing protein [Neolewinella sp.]|uniref:carboxypeptidase-like regulatory domain-containing protein n=1 Tax=Neolewinella sp. TaxID=2993543 RepID=UPI003B51B8D5
MRHTQYSSTLVLLLLVLYLPAQDTLTYRGTVFDEQSGEPLPFVFVSLSGDPTRGVLSNEQGDYQLELAGERYRGDTLVFSLLSYADFRHPVATTDTARLDVRLATSFIDLGTVVVISDLGLRELVRRTVAAIPQNYGHEDYLLRAYYRKYDIDDGEYSQLQEAILNIRDGVYEPEPALAHGWIDEYRSTDYSGPEINFFWPKINTQQTMLSLYEGPGNFARSGRYAHTAGAFFKSVEALKTFHARTDDDRFWRHLTFANRGEYLSGTDTLVRIHYQLDPQIPGISQTIAEAAWNRGELLINKNDLAVLRYRHGDTGEGWYKDITYHKVAGKYYPKTIREIIRYRYAGEMKRHFSSRFFYVTDVTTDRKEIKGRKGKPIRRSEPYTAINLPYDPAFWHDNEKLQSIPAADALQFETNQLEAFEKSFRTNARRIKE